MTPELYEAFAATEATHWWFEGRRRVIDGVLRRHLRPRAQRRLLDVGCGTGGMFPVLERFGEVEGAEPSHEARAFVASRFPGRVVHACALPDGLPEGTWHVGCAFDVLEHLEDPVAALRALHARLTSDGQLVVTVPAFQALWSKHDEANQHFRRYRRRQLVAELAEGGFEARYVSYFNATLFPAVAGARVLQRLVPSLDRGASDLSATPEPLNGVLTALFGAERHLVGRARLPVGVSLIVVAQRV